MNILSWITALVTTKIIPNIQFWPGYLVFYNLAILGLTHLVKRNRISQVTPLWTGERTASLSLMGFLLLCPVGHWYFKTAIAMDIWHQWDLIKINGWRANGILTSVLVCTWTDQVNAKQKLHMPHATIFISRMRSVMPRVTRCAIKSSSLIISWHFIHSPLLSRTNKQEHMEIKPPGNSTLWFCLFFHHVFVFSTASCWSFVYVQMCLRWASFLNVRMKCTYRLCLFHSFNELIHPR